MFEAFVNDRNKRTRTSARRGSCVISNDLIWYNRSNVTDDLKRSIIFTGLLSFTSSSKHSFYPYVLSIFRLTVRSKFFYPLLSIILVTRTFHTYVNRTQVQARVRPRSIAFSRQRFYNSFFTLLRNLLSVNEHTSQTSCSAVSRETGEGEACREWTCWRHEKNATLSTANVSNNHSNDSSDLSINFLFPL